MNIARRTGTAVAAATLLLSLGLAGCSSSSDSSAEDQQAYCTSLSTLDTQLTKLTAMVAEGSSSVQAVSDQAKAVKTAFNSTANDAGNVAQEAVDQVKAADADFDKAIAAIPADATVDQAKTVYRTATAAYAADVASAKQTLNC